MLKYDPDCLIQEVFKSEQEFFVNRSLVSIIIQSHKHLPYIFRYFRILTMLAMCLDHVIEPFRNKSHAIVARAQHIDNAVP